MLSLVIWKAKPERWKKFNQIVIDIAKNNWKDHELPEGLKFVAEYVVPDGWYVSIYESDTLEPVYKVVNIWSHYLDEVEVHPVLELRDYHKLIGMELGSGDTKWLGHYFPSK